MPQPFTAAPWSAQRAGFIHAQNGSPDSTLVATLQDPAPARLLAAAPNLLLALELAKPILEEQMHKLTGLAMVAMLTARNCTNDAIVHARIGYSTSDKPARLWVVNGELPANEILANERLLDAAAELHAAARQAIDALAGHRQHVAVLDSLQDALAAAHGA